MKGYAKINSFLKSRREELELEYILAQFNNEFIRNKFYISAAIVDDNSTLFDIRCNSCLTVIKFQDIDKTKAEHLMNKCKLECRDNNDKYYFCGQEIIEALKKMILDGASININKTNSDYGIIIAFCEKQNIRETDVIKPIQYSQKYNEPISDKVKKLIDTNIATIIPLIRDKFSMTDSYYEHNDDSMIYKFDNRYKTIAAMGSIINVSKVNIVLVKFQGMNNDVSRKTMEVNKFFIKGNITDGSTLKDAFLKVAMLGNDMSVGKMETPNLGIYIVIFAMHNSKIDTNLMTEFVYKNFYLTLRVAKSADSFGLPIKYDIVRHA